MKIVKKVMQIFFISIMILLIILSISYVNHKLQLKKEDILFKSLG